MPRYRIYNPTRSSIPLPAPLHGFVLSQSTITLDVEAVKVDTQGMRRLTRAGKLKVTVENDQTTPDEIEIGPLALAPASGGAPSGPAGGDLAGAYPNPTVERLSFLGGSLGLGAVADGQLLARDGGEIVGVSPAQEQDHEGLDTLTHRIAEDSFTELEYSGGTVVKTTVWASNLMLKKIRETVLSYDGADLIASTTTQFNGMGDPIAVLTKALSYDQAGNLVSVTSEKVVL